MSASDVLMRWYDETNARRLRLSTATRRSGGIAEPTEVDEQIPTDVGQLFETSESQPRRRPSGTQPARRFQALPPANGPLAKLRERWRIMRVDAYTLATRLAMWPLRKARPLLLAAIACSATTAAAAHRWGWQARNLLRRARDTDAEWNGSQPHLALAPSLALSLSLALVFTLALTLTLDPLPSPSTSPRWNQRRQQRQLREEPQLDWYY